MIVVPGEVLVMKRNKMQLKGQLRMYMRWPLIMTLLLIGMDVWVYMVDKKAGLLMSVIIIIYVGIAQIAESIRGGGQG